MSARDHFFNRHLHVRADASAADPQPPPAVAANSVQRRSTSLEHRKWWQTNPPDFADKPPSDVARAKSVGYKPSGDRAAPFLAAPAPAVNIEKPTAAVAVLDQQPVPAAPAPAVKIEKETTAAADGGSDAQSADATAATVPAETRTSANVVFLCRARGRTQSDGAILR